MYSSQMYRFIKSVLYANRRYDEYVTSNGSMVVGWVLTFADETPWKYTDFNFHFFRKREIKYYQGAVASTLDAKYLHLSWEQYEQQNPLEAKAIGRGIFEGQKRFVKRWKIAYFLDEMVENSMKALKNMPRYKEHMDYFLALTEKIILKTMYHERRHRIQETTPDLLKLEDWNEEVKWTQDSIEIDAEVWANAQMNWHHYSHEVLGKWARLTTTNKQPITK